jgi:hypothetical protein
LACVGSDCAGRFAAFLTGAQVGVADGLAACLAATFGFLSGFASGLGCSAFFLSCMAGFALVFGPLAAGIAGIGRFAAGTACFAAFAACIACVLCMAGMAGMAVLGCSASTGREHIAGTTATGTPGSTFLYATPEFSANLSLAR